MIFFMERMPAYTRRCFFFVLAAMVFSTPAPGSAAGKNSGQASQAPVVIYRGKASFLSDYFHGRKTANGEIFHQQKLTAAHKTLPFGVVLRVTRLSNGRSVVVRVNDRGPFIAGRHVDLSKLAAERLNMIKSGVTPVEFEIISDRKGKPLRHDEAFYLMFGAAPDLAEACGLVPGIRATIPAKLRGQLPEPVVFSHEDGPREARYFVGMGPFRDFNEAHQTFFRLPQKIRPELICTAARPEAFTISPAQARQGLQ